jgi:cell division protein FtsI (penicillin-binding protein 3)
MAEVNNVPRLKYGNHGDIGWLCDELDITVSPESHTSEWVVNFNEDNGVRLEPRIIREGTVPNVKGMTARDAIYILEKMGLNTRVKGYGTVSKQSVAPGTTVRKNQEIILTLSARG